MRRLIYGTVLVAVLSLGAALGVQSAHAASEKTSQAATVAQSETIDRSWYKTGQTITIDGTVNGDVYCAAQKVVITGTVTGDVLCAAQQIELRDGATVAGNVRVMGQMIRLSDSATVQKNATLFGQVVELSKKSTVAGDVMGAGQTVSLNGKIGRDVRIGGQDVTIAGQVGRNVKTNVQSLQLDKEAAIHGNLHYFAEKKSDLPAAAVDGKITYTQVEPSTSQHGPTIWSYLFGVVTFVLFGMALVLALPRFFQRATTTTGRHFGLALIVGMAASAIIPMAAIVALLTLALWPVAVVLMLTWLLIIIVGLPAFAYLVGRFMFGSRYSNTITTMLLGTFVVGMLFLIPIVNIILYVVMVFTGAGLVLLDIAKFIQKPRYRVAELESQPTVTKKPRPKK